MKIHIWYNGQFGLMISWGTQFEGRKYISLDLPFLIIQILGKRPKKLNGRIFSSDNKEICPKCNSANIMSYDPGTDLCNDCGHSWLIS